MVAIQPIITASLLFTPALVAAASHSPRHATETKLTVREYISSLSRREIYDIIDELEARTRTDEGIMPHPLSLQPPLRKVKQKFRNVATKVIDAIRSKKATQHGDVGGSQDDERPPPVPDHTHNKLYPPFDPEAYRKLMKKQPVPDDEFRTETRGPVDTTMNELYERDSEEHDVRDFDEDKWLEARGDIHSDLWERWYSYMDEMD